jgi:hypothetical protein
MFADRGLLGAGLAPALAGTSRRSIGAPPKPAHAAASDRNSKGTRKRCPYMPVLVPALLSLVAHEDLVDHAVFLGRLGVHIEVAVEVALDPFGVLAGVLRQDVAQEVV